MAFRRKANRQRGGYDLSKRSKNFPKTHDCQSIVGFFINPIAARDKRPRKVTMKRNYRKVLTEYAPETRFGVTPAPVRGEPERELERFKNQLLQKALKEENKSELRDLLRHAANEAAGLAWLTPFPLLFLPALVEEKVRNAARQAERQQALFERSRPTSEVSV